MNFNLSKCKGSWLHDFKIYREFSEGTQEKCGKCGIRVFFRAVNGRIDNNRYLSFHMKQVLFPNHPRFAKEYAR